MIHREELLKLFEEVATKQTSGGDALLVFVDEINALLDSSSVYGAFLSPLEDGIYVRNGKTFSLKPCVWIFAGTRLKDDARTDTQKLSDFKSRITLEKLLDYDSILNKVSDNNQKKAIRRISDLESCLPGTRPCLASSLSRLRKPSPQATDGAISSANK